jgi:hypothetical protein
MESIPYAFNYRVSYETDDEYRQELARVFGQLPIEKVPYGPAPPCTNEPLTYPQRAQVAVDFDAIDPIICAIVANAKKDLCMRTLLEKAAGRLLSTDLEKGGVMLFSYTAFDLFHACLQTFLYASEQWNDQNIYYKELMRRMAKRPK